MSAPAQSSGFLWRVTSLAAAGGGAFLIATSRGTLPGAILLLVVALAASGVLLGGGGGAGEGVLDLSGRLGLGLLGGVLGGLAVVVARGALVSLGLAEALDVALTTGWSRSSLLDVMGGAAVWGVVLGMLYPHIPGRSAGTRGALFSLAPSLYALLKVYPIDRDAGVFGIDLGLFTFVFVIGLNFLWGAVAGATIGWGETAEEAPVAGPLDR